MQIYNHAFDYSHKWYAFTGIVLLSFGCYLDYTVVNIALPTIQQELHANLGLLQWVMNIYFLALCVLATAMGRLGDLYGRRRVFYTGTIIFGLASIIAGFAPNIMCLIFGRFLQGVGAAIVFPLGPSLLPQSFPEKERAKAIAWFGSLGGIALALGPVLGGVIVAYWGWRWIFFINVPIILLGYVFCFKFIEESPLTHKHISLDIPGMIWLALMMSFIVLSLIRSQHVGWSHPLTLLFLFIGIIAAVLLIRTERKQENPLVDFKDFSNLLFFSGAILCFLAGVLSAVALFFDPLYLQIIKHQSPQLSGLVLFAIPVAVFFVAFLVGWLIALFGMLNTILLGLILACVATFLQVFFNMNTSIPYIIIAFIFLGSMWALGNTVTIIAAQTAVGHLRMSVATGTLVTMFNIGGSIGLAIAIVVYDFAATALLKTQIMQLQPSLSIDQQTHLKDFISNPSNALQLPITDVTRQLFNTLFIQGFVYVMLFLLLFSLIALAIVFIWKIKTNTKIS